MLYANFESNVVGIELKASSESCKSQSFIISEILFSVASQSHAAGYLDSGDRWL